MYDRKPIPAIPQRLYETAREHGLYVRVEPLRYVRGWPEQSPRPYRLERGNSTLIGAYGTLAALEAKVRALVGAPL